MSEQSEPTTRSEGAAGDGSVARALRDAQTLLGGSELLALAEAAPVGLFVSIQPQGLVLVNSRFADILGRRRRDLMGHGWLESVHPDDRERIGAVAARAAELDQ